MILNIKWIQVDGVEVKHNNFNLYLGIEKGVKDEYINIGNKSISTRWCWTKEWRIISVDWEISLDGWNSNEDKKKEYDGDEIYYIEFIDDDIPPALLPLLFSSNRQIYLMIKTKIKVNTLWGMNLGIRRKEMNRWR